VPDDTRQEVQEAEETGPVFGVAFGSFHFGLNPTASPPDTLQQYVDSVRHDLEAISSVERVEVPDLPAKQGSRPLKAPDTPPDLERLGKFFPRLAQGQDIQFTLQIPARTQREVFSVRSTEGLGERFRVTMTHDWGRALAMVHPLDANVRMVSASVAMVREFLRREFERLPTALLRFECMGPSPVHAEFLLAPILHADPLLTDRFEVQEHRRLGYHLYRIGYDPGLSHDKASIATAWFRRIRIELALYYRIVAAENEQLFGWDELSDSVNQIVNTQREGGPQAFLARTFRRRPTNEALINLSLFEMEEIETRESLNRQLSQDYDEGERGLLESLITHRMNGLRRPPINQLAELLRRFEGTRVTDRDLVFIVFSSVIGAAIGAMATLISAG
jgi:hypothetical protein